MRLTLLISSLLIAFAPRVARGDERPMANLRYTRGAGAERCPDEGTLRSAVAARLGRDPWDPAAARTVIVAVGREGKGLHARVELRDRDGRITGLREMDSPGQDCIELAAAVQLAISIAIDPLSFTHPAPEPHGPEGDQAGAGPPAKAVARREGPKHRRADVSSPAERETRLRVDVSLGGLAALGSAPAVAGGFALQGRLQWGWFSVALEARVDLPAYREIEGGEISSSLLLAGGVGCLHVRSLFGCGLVYGGVLRGAGHEIARPERTTLPYAATGIRLGVEIPLYSILSLRLCADLLATLTRITLHETDGPEEYWSTPPVSGALGAAAVGRFR